MIDLVYPAGNITIRLPFPLARIFGRSANLRSTEREIVSYIFEGEVEAWTLTLKNVTYNF